MKKLFFLLIVIGSIAGCKKKSTAELLINKWQVTDMKSRSGKVTPEEQLKQFKLLVIEFKKDGKVLMNGGPASNMETTYTVSEDGKTVNIKEASGNNSANEVVSISDSKLVLNEKEYTITLEAKK